MATTVHVKNIAKDTTETQVREFFSFCGKITSLSVTPEGSTQSAAITFEKASAGKTALLLDSTQLGANIVNVTSAASLDDLSGNDSSAAAAAGSTGDHERDVDQEDKPRSRIVAEYLAHGYHISDQAITKALALDKQHGYSSRFTSALQSFDSKYKATEQAKSIDSKYALSEKANQGWRSMSSYFEKALGTPTGRKLHAFYQQGEKQVLDVHNEARRLANMKAGIHNPEPVPGDAAHTHCGCGGASGVCGCAPGKCACATCPKNSNESHPSAEDKQKMGFEQVAGTERTKCTCAGKDGVCVCEPGKCSCSSCGKNPDAPVPGSTAAA